jgi:hypothetical protein
MKRTHGRKLQLNRETLRRLKKGASMSRVFHRLPLALCLALLFIVQARLNAAPAPAPRSTAAFLATLADKPACEASGENAPIDIPLQAPDPAFRVIYPCGNLCGEYQCQNAYYQEPCLTQVGDQPGRCVSKNEVCPNEPLRSPCWCKPW